MTTYLKALGPNRECINGGRGSWPEPGVWTEPIPPIDGHRGWHVTTPEGMLADWLPDTRNTLWEVEIIGQVARSKNKQAVEQARLVRRLNWTDQIARLFAADCAEATLDILATRPIPLPAWMIRRGERRRRLIGIEAARRAAYGEIGRRELTEAYALICYPHGTRGDRRRRDHVMWLLDISGLYGEPPVWTRSPRRYATQCAAIACTPATSGVHIARLANRAAVNAGADPAELARLFLRRIQPTDLAPEPVEAAPEISQPTNPNLEVHQP